jgi:fido (protein-threonine AMPylation protein)
VHNSTAIEGNTMTRAQVEALVDRRRMSATFGESMDVAGYSEAADWIYRHASEHEGVPLPVVSEIHRIALGLAWHFDPPLTRDEPGAWRTIPVRVRDVNVSSPVAIHADLQAWSDSTRKPDASSHALIHAAVHHAWFERIHPFVDGNGRVGRLLLNFMLVQAGYPPAVILATQRQRYLQGLKLADTGNPNLLAEILARAVSGALSRFLIPNLAGEAKLVPLTALAARGPYSAAYLRQLVLKGRLRAIRDGNLWLSSRAWLSDYVAARDPRGGRPARAYQTGMENSAPAPARRPVHRSVKIGRR